MTSKQRSDKFNQKAIAKATEWNQKYTKEQLAMAVWNAFGLPTEIKNDKVIIYANHKVIAEI